MFENILYPKSIVVIGGSNDVSKPGGKALFNIKNNGYDGSLFVINPKGDVVQDLPTFKLLNELDIVPDLAIIVIPPKFVLQTVKDLIQMDVKGIIIMTAGFGEMSEEGKKIEQQMAEMASKNGVTLVGPNCMGVISTSYAGIFAGPIPPIKKGSVDFVSGSGATAAFIMEQSVPRGLAINTLITVGNSAQIGIEDVLSYWDKSFDQDTSAKLKMIYMENIKSPQRFLQHCRSLIKKGCSIVALKSGATEAGSRAASSHTGAMVSSDTAVSALLEKAGVIRVDSKMELVDVAGVFFDFPALRGKNVCIVTHAGGPGVMLADELSRQGFNVPELSQDAQQRILDEVLHGSAATNPIDFLAAGTHEHLKYILGVVQGASDIDAICVIFGSTGLFDTMPAYNVVLEEMQNSDIPIYPVFTGYHSDEENLHRFVSKGGFYFQEEVNLARAMGDVFRKPDVYDYEETVMISRGKIREVIAPYLDSDTKVIEQADVEKIMNYCGIELPPEKICTELDEAIEFAKEIGFPVVMKVVGILHKTESGGVLLNLNSEKCVEDGFNTLMAIDGATGVMVQKMVSGNEIILGIKKEEKFGHLIMCGLGGIFTEVLKDVAFGLAPLVHDEADRMLKSLKSFPIIKGVRGKEGISIEKLSDTIVKLSILPMVVPEIIEMDINPLIGEGKQIYAVDSRIILE